MELIISLPRVGVRVTCNKVSLCLMKVAVRVLYHKVRVYLLRVAVRVTCHKPASAGRHGTEEQRLIKIDAKRNTSAEKLQVTH